MERIVFMLKRIGCELIAKALPRMSPPVTISLEEAAMQAGDNFELGFFTHLKTAIKEVKQEGAPAIVFEDVKRSVCILSRRDTWDERCEKLEEEILNYLQELGETPKRQAEGRRIHIPFKPLSSS